MEDNIINFSIKIVDIPDIIGLIVWCALNRKVFIEKKIKVDCVFRSKYELTNSFLN